MWRAPCLQPTRFKQCLIPLFILRQLGTTDESYYSIDVNIIYSRIKAQVRNIRLSAPDANTIIFELRAGDTAAGTSASPSGSARRDCQVVQLSLIMARRSKVSYGFTLNPALRIPAMVVLPAPSNPADRMRRALRSDISLSGENMQVVSFARCSGSPTAFPPV